MAVGANIKYASTKRVQSIIFRLLGRRPETGHANHKYCSKAGVPATNTALDNPLALNDMCLDRTNNHVYLCTAYSADASATTWTQIV